MDKFTEKTAPDKATPDALHEAYVEAINSAVQAGQDGVAHELVAIYLDERRTPVVEDDDRMAA